MQKAKICLLIDRNNFLSWHVKIIEQLLVSQKVEIVSILFSNNNKSSFLWNQFSFMLGFKKKLLRNSTLPNSIINNPHISIINSTNDFDFSDPNISNFIEEQKVDIVLNISDIQLLQTKNAISNLQIWYFNFHKNSSEPKYPIGFYEFLKKEKVISFSLEKIISESEVEILLEGTLKVTQYSISKTIHDVLKEAINFPAKAIDLYSNRLISIKKIREKNYRTITYPTFGEIVKILFLQIRGFFKFIWSRGFFVDHWNVGYIEKPVFSFLSSEIKNSEITWFPANTKRFIADSFFYEKKGEKYVFFEGLNYSEGIGYISVAKLENMSLINEKIIIQEPFHLSYPYIVEDNDKIYCIPESNEANSINLYQAVKFPYEWKKEKTLINNIKGIDSTIFNYDKLWWLFTTLKNDGPHFKLQIYYCESLTGDWKPHQNNPVKIDIRSSRGAGEPFYFEGKLYRPSQDYSEKIEGRIRINLIKILSPTEFHEEEVCIVDPFNKSRFPDKIHTLSSRNNITVIDGCKEIFILSNPKIAYFKFMRILNHLLKK